MPPSPVYPSPMSPQPRVPQPHVTPQPCVPQPRGSPSLLKMPGLVSGCPGLCHCPLVKWHCMGAGQAPAGPCSSGLSWHSVMWPWGVNYPSQQLWAGGPALGIHSPRGERPSGCAT